MIWKKKKLPLIICVDGNFQLSGDRFYSTSEKPQYYVNILPQGCKSDPHQSPVKDSYIAHPCTRYDCYITDVNMINPNILNIYFNSKCIQK